MTIFKTLKGEAKKALMYPPRKLRDMRERATEKRMRATWLSPAEIAKYRTTIKIYDAFTFFNELDMLEIRLNVLDPYVDFFVLLEATETYSGNPKPLYFEENKARFKKWEHKIIHHIVKDVPHDEAEMQKRVADPATSEIDRQILHCVLSSNTVGLTVKHWFREFYIKESLKKALAGLHDSDVCYISDLDEIWDPHLIIDYSKDGLFKPRQTAYMYYLNNRSDEDWTGWTGTLVTRYKRIRESCLNSLLKNDNPEHIGLANGGWHFTFQGGYEGAMKKIVESDHPFYKTGETLPKLKDSVAKNRDYKGRHIRFKIDESKLPEYLKANREKYARFFK